jgi:hypothetical protein
MGHQVSNLEVISALILLTTYFVMLQLKLHSHQSVLRDSSRLTGRAHRRWGIFLITRIKLPVD